jgi:signal transduction histidine kinase
MIDVAVILALSTLAIGSVAALLIKLLPSIRLQLTALALLAVTLPLGGVLASGWVMFHMHDDVKILAVSAAAALSAVIGALFVARLVLRPIEQLRGVARRLATGDLTARADLLNPPSELSELAGSFNEMASSVERLFDARRQLVAWASHDLRTPIAAMRAMLEAIEDDLAAADEYLPALREQVTGLTLLSEDLFELACIDAGALTPQLRNVELRDVVDSCLRAMDAQARTRHVHLHATINPATLTVAAAPDKLERVLLNLLTNALRHTPSDGSVAVLVHNADERTIHVAVEDTGIGLDRETSDRMFERFWKADESRSRTEGGGAGLGLAIARGLVEAQGGTIWAEPRPGGGARVVFALPAHA